MKGHNARLHGKGIEEWKELWEAMRGEMIMETSNVY
jgi:hypothetical protein